MNDVLYEDAIRAAKDLFLRDKVTGSGGNISFRDGDMIYISQSGTSFGHLSKEDFAEVKIDGTIIKGVPSKELPFHLFLYQVNKDNNCVIHTHSFNSTLLSCFKKCDEMLAKMMTYTPYLKMQSAGRYAIVDYGAPGSEELFAHFKKVIDSDTKVYLMRNHGITVTGSTIAKTFNLLEEFETSARLYFALSQYDEKEIERIENK